MKINLIKISVLFFLTSACTVNKKSLSDSTSADEIRIKEHSILAVLWQQNAAEYSALCHQAFNIARLRLDQFVKQSKFDKPLAIITDIDETILDNSQYSAKLINNDENYNKESWLEWGRLESATLVPGAYEFIKYAENLGVEVFYVSNRYSEQLDGTINNLKKVGLDNVERSRVYLRTHTSGKEERRKKINETHEVLLLLGDNLSDFDDVYDGQNTSQRNQHVENMKTSFGQRFIVFPNPMYGDWETKGIYEGNRFSESEKADMRMKKLKHF